MLEEACASPDPQVRSAWAAIPHNGTHPTVDEVIEYIADRLEQHEKPHV